MIESTLVAALEAEELVALALLLGQFQSFFIDHVFDSTFLGKLIQVVARKTKVYHFRRQSLQHCIAELLHELLARGARG